MTKEGTCVSEKTRVVSHTECSTSGKQLYRVAASLAMALVMLCGLLWPFGTSSLTTAVPRPVTFLSASQLTASAAAPHDSGMTASSKGIKVTQVDGVWVATRNGVIDTSYTGVAQNGFGWWKVTKGYVDFDYTGIAQNEYGWWRIEGGKVNFNYTGVANNEMGWWRVQNGKVDFGATGVYQNSLGWWYVRRGKVDFSYTGIAGNQYGYWYIRTGQVDFSMNGRVSALGNNWTVTNGSAVGDIPTRVHNAFVNAGADTGSYQSGHNYCIAVNTSQNLVIVYGLDAAGEFTQPVKAFVASCGKNASPTKTGTFKTTDKYVWRALNGGVYGQYATRITGSYLFHSVPYYRQDKSTLETGEYNKLGSRASAGCVRLCVRDVKWIYDHCASGTIVTLYDDSGLQEPLMKPIAIRIPTNSRNAGWDPTDPDGRNPW